MERFQGPYKFLSNFFWSELDFQGLRYPSVEHAFQAAKLVENQQRVAYGFTSPSLSFGEAKRLGRQVALRKDWKEIREEAPDWPERHGKDMAQRQRSPPSMRGLFLEGGIVLIFSKD